MSRTCAARPAFTGPPAAVGPGRGAAAVLPRPGLESRRGEEGVYGGNAIIISVSVRAPAAVAVRVLCSLVEGACQDASLRELLHRARSRPAELSLAALGARRVSPHSPLHRRQRCRRVGQCGGGGEHVRWVQVGKTQDPSCVLQT